MKITCDIISDLLPSYVEDICTEDSRRLVEEHIRGCDKCKQKLTYMRNPIECPEILDKEEKRNPFMKIKKRNCIRIIVAVVITVCILGGAMFAVQEVGVLNEFFFPLSMSVIDNETGQSDWSQVNVDDEKFLNFSSIFYKKELVNDANSDGSVTVRILDENNNIVLGETTIKAGTSIDLDMLKNNQNYIVEAKCKTGRFFLNFV